MRNSFILGGGSRPEDVVSGTPRGLYAAVLGGGQVNPATGDFVFGVAEGYLIEDGKITAPVRGANLIGNGPNILAAIDAVADDVEIRDGVCGKEGQGAPVSNGSPTLRIARMTVGAPVADLEALCRAAVEAAAADEQVEAFAEETRRAQVRVRDAEVESFTSAETRGVRVRVIADGRLGYAYAADPDENGVRALVVAARDSAGFAEPDAGNVLPELGEVDEIPGLYREETAGLDPDRRVPMALDAERAATGSQAEVRRVESAGYGDAVTRMAVASTRGGPVGFGRTDCWAYAVALAERDGEVQTGFAYRLARSPDDLDPAEAGSEAAERAARLLGGTKPATEHLPVVLDPVAATGFLGVLAGSLSAESVLKGRSLLADRVGDRVGSAATVVDDARLAIGPAVAPVDDEGVRTGRTPLVEGGALRGFLHNTSTAARTGNGARSTGNAGRGTYRTPPAVRPTNLYLVPGETRARRPPDPGRSGGLRPGRHRAALGRESRVGRVLGEATGIRWRTGRSASRCGR